MKTKHFLSVLAFSCLAMSSQAQYYQFAHQNSTYEEFYDGIIIDSYQLITNAFVTINSDFYVHVFEDSSSDVIIGENYMFLERLAGIEVTQLYPLWYKSWINQSTNISHKTVGPIGNRILKIQYKNLGFSSTPDTNYFTNYQVWFYEGEDKVEFHYGPMSIPSSGELYLNDNGFNTFCPGVFIALVDVYNTDQSSPLSAHVFNTPEDPMYEQYFSSTNCAYQGFPNNGDVYQFYRSNLSIIEQSTFDIKIKQLDATSIFVESENDLLFGVTILSSEGKLLSTLSDLNMQAVNINFSSESKQILFVEITSVNGEKVRRKLVL